MRIAFFTLGCRSNFFDTQFMSEHFRQKGYEVVDFEDFADVYVINTCTVTAGADRSSRQFIYRAKRKNPKAVVVATGCYAQVNPQALANLKEVDLVVGNTDKHRIVQIVEEYLEGREQKVFVGNIFKEGELKNFDLITYYERSRPFLKVQEGCNKFCTFCVIPFARGKVRSVPIEKVVAEVELLAEKGFEEVVLTGTQLTQYGWDIGVSLYELLRELLKVKGIKLIRLSSVYPSEISKELLDMITSEERIAPHFHMSLQSGSNRILELMERHYTVEDYIRLVEAIISKRPISAIGTDIIVGFPGEREEDFKQTYTLLEALPIAYMHVFSYSDRPFTKASKFKEKVPAEVKEERVKLLKHLDQKKRKEFRKKNLNRRLRATVLSEDRLLTENYIEINMSLPERPGRVVDIIFKE